MSEATCAVLAAVFPLYLVTLVVERRSTNMGLRRLKLYRQVSFTSLALSAAGIFVAVAGVSSGGLSTAPGVIMWLLFGAASLGLIFVMTLSLASAEFEEDNHRPARRTIRPSSVGRRVTRGPSPIAARHRS